MLSELVGAADANNKLHFEVIDTAKRERRRQQGYKRHPIRLADNCASHNHIVKQIRCLGEPFEPKASTPFNHSGEARCHAVELTLLYEAKRGADPESHRADVEEPRGQGHHYTVVNVGQFGPIQCCELLRQVSPSGR
ncbi:hypothetical protein [Actinophytocola sp.]|uniref:hypothetical protein n=1 Tax=Actinophytocola sp. TaxID=1872138 RepID=UPI003D6BFBC9